MHLIGRLPARLEFSQEDFVVEVLAEVIAPQWIREVLRANDRESERQRDLPAPFMVWFVVLLGLFRRTSYSNLLEKIRGSWWAGATWKAEGCPCSSAISKARDRLGVEPLRDLFLVSRKTWLERTPGLEFHGKRVSALDGSTVKMPDTPENAEHFGKPSGGRGEGGYPLLRLMALLDVGSDIFREVRFGPYRVGELTLARQLVAALGPRDLVVMDRNFTAYDFLWDLRSTGADFVVRLKQTMTFREIKTRSEGDKVIEVEIPRYFRRKRPDMPRTWLLREITHIVNGEKIRYLTSLADPSIRSEEFPPLYKERWLEEGAYDELKTHLCACTQVNRPVVLRSRTPQRVEQELYGLFIAHNTIRVIMAEAAATVAIYCRSLSYTAAIERIREATRDMMQLRTVELRARYCQLLNAIARARVPERPDRHYPRAVKTKMSRYPLKRPA